MNSALLVCALASVASPNVQDDAVAYSRRWVYSMQNLQVAENAERTVELIERAAKAGFNGLVLADYKLNILDRVPDHYFANVAKVKAAAEASGVELIPAVFPIGYSNGLLAHDPNLVEALPTTSHFVVSQGAVRHEPHAGGKLTNGMLEESRDDKFNGFSFQDNPGKATVPDREVFHSGESSCRMQDTDATSSTGNARIVQSVEVNPWTCYRFSAWVKTRDLKNHGGFRLLALAEGSGKPLTFYEGGLEPTRDWSKVDVVFNSLNASRVNLYAGLWGGSKGTLWIDDLELQELALVNLVRRPGCPLEIATPDGATVFEEGRDFEPLVDPKLGQVPYAGEYEFEHAPPLIRLTKDSRIADGQRLIVRWYHPVLVHGSQVACCLSEPKVYDLLRDQAKRVDELFHPKTFFFSHDELRVANWCRACKDRKLTPGELLADNVKRCVEIIRAQNPDAQIVVWSDMFDPDHNAVADYYLVNGSLDGSWNGLLREVTIANWNSGKARQSLSFFSERGHRQIVAGFYDADDLDGFTRWNDAAKGIAGVDGFMYTTWRGRYDLLERYGAALK